MVMACAVIFINASDRGINAVFHRAINGPFTVITNG
jgi:hypothetical protein